MTWRLGWGNNELQYHGKATQKCPHGRGNLIIEAHKEDEGMAWSSARLTTRGKVALPMAGSSFGPRCPKIAATESQDGPWEIAIDSSWPYCGEIDILRP